MVTFPRPNIYADKAITNRTDSPCVEIHQWEWSLPQSLSHTRQANEDGCCVQAQCVSEWEEACEACFKRVCAALSVRTIAKCKVSARSVILSSYLEMYEAYRILALNNSKVQGQRESQ